MMRQLGNAIAFAALLVLSSHSVADTVYYEGFSTDLGDWGPTRGSDAVIVHQASGLSYGTTAANTLATTGGAMKVTQPTASSASNDERIGDLSGTADPLGTTRPGSYWVSHLIQVPTGQTSGDAFWTTDGAWDKGTAGIQGNSNFRYINGDVSGVSAADGEVHLIVMEINRADVAANNTDDPNNPDTANAWIDPLDFSNLGAPDITFSGNGNDRVRPIADEAGFFKLNRFGEDGAMYVFDELRIGMTAADVLPLAVPEPASLGLLALCVSGGLMLRYRKK